MHFLYMGTIEDAKRAAEEKALDAKRAADAAPTDPAATAAPAYAFCVLLPHEIHRTPFAVSLPAPLRWIHMSRAEITHAVSSAWLIQRMQPKKASSADQALDLSKQVSPAVISAWDAPEEGKNHTLPRWFLVPEPANFNTGYEHVFAMDKAAEKKKAAAKAAGSL